MINNIAKNNIENTIDNFNLEMEKIISDKIFDIGLLASVQIKVGEIISQIGALPDPNDIIDLSNKTIKNLTNLLDQIKVIDTIQTQVYFRCLSLIIENTFSNAREIVVNKELEHTVASNSSTLDLKDLQLTVFPHLSHIVKSSYLEKITKLYLNKNDLKLLPANIVKLKNLETLNLSENNLETLPSEIENLKFLKILKVDNNKLTHIPIAITKLCSLQYLNFSNNELKKLPKEIGEITSLMELHLANNEIEILPPNIENLNSLIKLNIRSNKLIDIPIQIKGLSSLLNLNFSDNELKTLPKEIGEITSLIKLYLDNNKIEVLPPEIGQLESLQKLVLESNFIENIPKEIGDLKSLKYLDMSSNFLKSLPHELGKLLNLQGLSLSSNYDLEEFPLSLGNLTELILLETDDTSISEVTRDAIIELIKAKRDEMNVEILPAHLKIWFSLVDQDPGFSLAEQKTQEFMENLNQILSKEELSEMNKKATLCDWLIRLEKTKDFQSVGLQATLATRVTSMLETVLTNSEFREAFFNHAAVNNAGCEDRSGMAFNELYTIWKITTLPADASMKEKLSLLVSGAKTLALRIEISKEIDAEQKRINNESILPNSSFTSESVEIYLYYESNLKEELKLLTAITTPTYAEEIGKRDWISRDELIKKVEQNYVKILIEYPLFETIIREDKTLQKSLEKVDEENSNHMQSLSESSHAEAPNDSEEKLEWITSMNLLKAKRDSERVDVVKKWLQTLKKRAHSTISQKENSET